MGGQPRTRQLERSTLLSEFLKQFNEEKLVVLTGRSFQTLIIKDVTQDYDKTTSASGSSMNGTNSHSLSLKHHLSTPSKTGWTSTAQIRVTTADMATQPINLKYKYKITGIFKKNIQQFLESRFIEYSSRVVLYFVMKEMNVLMHLMIESFLKNLHQYE